MKLLTVAYYVVSGADVGLFKLCVNWFFNSERQTTPHIQQQLKEVDTIPTSLGILNFLVRNNFIGYLNYKLLKEFQKMVGNKELKEHIDKYETKHDEFLLSVNFNTIIEVFNLYPTLAPASHIGLPEFEIHLEAPWNDKRIFEWTEFFEMRSSWPPYLFVTGVLRMCIVLTYAVLPIFISSVVRDLTNPEILRELEDNGVKVQLSKELLGMNTRMSKVATNEENDVDKRTILSNQLSFSDGGIHTLGIRECTSSMVIYI